LTAPAKLAAFGAILAAIFGVAFLTGSQSAVLLAPPAVHSNELGGQSASVDGYTLTAVEPVVDPGEDVFVEFSITGPDGRTAPELDDVDGSHVHVFAIRHDLTGFQHVTPDPGPGTSWWPVLNLTPGPWQVVVELQPVALGREITLATGFTVSGDYRAEPLPAPADQQVINGLTVRRSGALTTGPGSRSTFTITDAGQPVTDIQPAHNALGHAVIIRPSDLGYRHLHAVPTSDLGPRLEFEGGVPERGTYRVFVEFYRDEVRHVAAYTAEVTR
jgi:hypothetical protein